MNKPEDLDLRSFGPGFEELVEGPRVREGDYLEGQRVVVESVHVRSIRYVVDRKTMEGRDAAPALIAACGIPADAAVADEMLTEVDHEISDLVLEMDYAVVAAKADTQITRAIEKLDLAMKKAREAMDALPPTFWTPDPDETDETALAIGYATHALKASRTVLEARRRVFPPAVADRKRRAATAPLREVAAIKLAGIHRRYAIAPKNPGAARDEFVRAALEVIGEKPMELRDKNKRLTDYGRIIR